MSNADSTRRYDTRARIGQLGLTYPPLGTPLTLFTTSGHNLKFPARFNRSSSADNHRTSTARQWKCELPTCEFPFKTSTSAPHSQDITAFETNYGCYRNPCNLPTSRHCSRLLIIAPASIGPLHLYSTENNVISGQTTKPVIKPYYWICDIIVCRTQSNA